MKKVNSNRLRTWMVLFALAVLSESTLAQTVPWKPKPAPKDAPVEARCVLVVKQGIEHQRNQDGNSHAINSYSRFRIDRDPATGMYKIRRAGDDRQLFHDLDVDGDPKTTDTVCAHVFDLDPSIFQAVRFVQVDRELARPVLPLVELAQDISKRRRHNPISPHAPFYDTTVGTQRICGGIAIYQANIDTTGFSEDGMNSGEEGPANQGRRNWCLHHETLELFSPFRMCEVLLWQKRDFMNRGDACRVSFDDTCAIRHWIGRYWMGIDALRWIVRNGAQFYISESVYKGVNIHRIHPTKTRWAKYDPKAPYHIWKDPATMEFEEVEFDNVTAIGWYMAKDRLVTGYVGCKWEAFDADAIVHAPVRPSENIDMVEVTGDGLEPFYMSTCEVPYDLWRKTLRLFRTPAHAGVLGFNLDANGDAGSMRYTTGIEPEHAWPDLSNQPVTTIGLYDMIAWCNALSIQEYRTPCYYEDAEFTKPYYKVVQSPCFTKPLEPPTIHVRWDADGYRLPTVSEWAAAAADGRGQNLTDQPFTCPVGHSKPNGLGIYDLGGNVWEMVWTYGDRLAPDHPSRTVLGGSFLGAVEPESFSANPYGDRPFKGRFDIGLRLVRRRAGGKKPKDDDASDMPRWTIRKGTTSKPDKSRQPETPLNEPLVKQTNIPGTTYAMGRTEVTYAQWKTIYDWAVTHGYQFDYTGEMGSMSYWGFGNDWTPGTRGADEPVTGISRDMAMIWLNALSEMEGRTPVYYADKACRKVLRKTQIYRPLQWTPQERKDMYDGKIDRQDGQLTHAYYLPSAPFFLRGDADGYRLPTTKEWKHAAMAGSKARWPWGDDVTQYDAYAWTASNSQFRTHPVGVKRPNAWGLHDMIGNVAELTNAVNARNNYTGRLGMGFFDVLDGYDHILRAIGTTDRSLPEQVRGLTYPDVGFRVLRQNASQPLRQSKVIPAAPHTFFASYNADEPQPAAQAGDFDPLQGLVHRGNLMRTGEFEATGAPKLAEVAWTFRTQGPVRSSPVVVDGVVYVGSNDGKVYAIEAGTGAERWSFDTGGPVTGSAAIVDSVVYIASECGALFALDTKTGQRLWEVKTGQPTAGSPAVLNGQVIIGQGARGGSTVLVMTARPIISVDARTGTILWTGTYGPQGHTAIATEGKRLYAGSSDAPGCMSLAGAKIWMQRTGHQQRVFMSQTVVGDDVYVPIAIGGQVIKFQAADGNLVWRNASFEKNLVLQMNAGGEFGHECFTDLAVADGLVYAGFNDGQLVAFDAQSGKRVWTYRIEKPIHSSPSVASGVVYFGGWDGLLYALDAKTGKLLAKRELGDKIVSSPWIAAGIVYVGSDDGHVYAIE